MSASSCIGRWSCWGGRHARNVLLLGFGAKDFAVTTEVESGVGRCLSVGTAESERIYIINLFPLFFAIDFRPRRCISVLDLVIFPSHKSSYSRTPPRPVDVQLCCFLVVIVYLT